MASPLKGLRNLVDENFVFALMLVILMACILFIWIIAFVYLKRRAARREMHLRASLIRQMEATQQAERKSLNKSLAFATASHDIRALLAGLVGLIQVCQDEVAPGSDLGINLMQMEACTKDLLGILNSILDMNKIEAGKMQLEEEEFDLAQLVEDVIDMYHPVGMKKGVDVVLDPCDGSISKFSVAKGDRTKLKQILSNLLSNAIKFTSEGHVAVRGWARKPSVGSPMVFPSAEKSPLDCVSCFTFKRDKAPGDLKRANAVQQNPNCLEFVFEVDDTGTGIPKEKRSFVFENYIQLKDTTTEQQGTGLGLGIVQSLVRLMGGDIRIVDKDLGKKGTCFRFNIFLTASSNNTPITALSGDIESHGGSIPGDSFLSTQPICPKQEASSDVILFIRSHARQRISRKFFESLGIKVSAVKNLEQFRRALKKIKQKINLSQHSHSARSELSVRSFSSDSNNCRTKELPLSALQGTDHIVPQQLHQRIYNLKVRNIMQNFVLIVIDTSAGPFRELSRSVAEFRKDLHNTCCTIVWIDKPGARSIQSKGLDEDKLPPTDMIISKPLHGSRLYQVIGLLPEFGGALPKTSRSQRRFQAGNVPLALHSLSDTDRNKESAKVSSQNRLLQVGETKELEAGTSSERPLSGKKILVAEDKAMLRRLAVAVISTLGASVEACENGEQALELVRRGLSGGVSRFSPYDYILMDCEMPVMNGFEATRRIRDEERHYGVHIPVIALTAYAEGEEGSKIKVAGMDFHLVKPLRKEQLMEAIAYIHSR
ncbi:Histidine kinase [Bertholletia excelsa]